MDIDAKLGQYTVLGLLIGAVFGWAVGAAIGGTYMVIAIGAIVGVLVGWFLGAATMKR